MMHVNNALEGLNACTELRKSLAKIPYNSDLHKYLRNVEQMVKELSKLEVENRRTPHRLKQPLEELNNAIGYLEKMILIAQLMS